MQSSEQRRGRLASPPARLLPSLVRRYEPAGLFGARVDSMVDCAPPQCSLSTIALPASENSSGMDGRRLQAEASFVTTAPWEDRHPVLYWLGLGGFCVLVLAACICVPELIAWTEGGRR